MEYNLEYNNIEIVMIPDIAVNTDPVASLSDDSKIVTYEIDDITSFVYELTYTGIKEDIVVKEYTGPIEYDFTIYTNGLTPCEELCSDNSS